MSQTVSARVSSVAATHKPRAPTVATRHSATPCQTISPPVPNPHLTRAPGSSLMRMAAARVSQEVVTRAALRRTTSRQAGHRAGWAQREVPLTPSWTTNSSRTNTMGHPWMSVKFKWGRASDVVLIPCQHMKTNDQGLFVLLFSIWPFAAANLVSWW